MPWRQELEKEEGTGRDGRALGGLEPGGRISCWETSHRTKDKSLDGEGYEKDHQEDKH